MRTLRAIAPEGTVNPTGAVHGTITGYAEATIDGSTVRLAAFHPDYPRSNAPTSKSAETLEAFVQPAEPVYVKDADLDTFTYEPSISVTHDGGSFDSPEDSAETLLTWLRDEVTSGETDVHVHVACEDGFTYSVHVTKDENGKFVSKVESVWKGGIR